MTRKLIFSKDGQDILQGIDLKCTKALAFGGECYDVFHVGVKIGEIHFGTPANEMLEGYSWRIAEEPATTGIEDQTTVPGDRQP